MSALSHGLQRTIRRRVPSALSKKNPSGHHRQPRFRSESEWLPDAYRIQSEKEISQKKYRESRRQRPTEERYAANTPFRDHSKQLHPGSLNGERRRLETEQYAFYEVIHSYRLGLFPSFVCAEHESWLDDGSKVLGLLAWLHNHIGVEENSSTVDWSKLVATEKDFKILCKTTQNLIRGFAALPSTTTTTSHTSRDAELSPSLVAEWLLWSLIQIRQDRADLIQKVCSRPTEPPPKEEISWGSWMKSILPFSSVEKPQEPIENEPVLTAHDDASLGPVKFHFEEVMSSILNENTCRNEPTEISNRVIDPSDVMAVRLEDRRFQRGMPHKESAKRALRIEALFHQVSKIGMPLDKALHLTLEAYAETGTLEGAMSAKRLLEQTFPHLPRDPFLIVLGAFCHAALWDPSVHRREKAAKYTEYLVQQRQSDLMTEGTGKPQMGQSPDLYALVLHAFFNAGKRILPDLLVRARRVMGRCLGEKDFLRLISFEPTNNQSDVWLEDDCVIGVPLLDNLILIYASSTDEVALSQAKSVLAFMEHVRTKRAKQFMARGRKLVAPFPNSETYNNVLWGIMKYLKNEVQSASQKPSKANRSGIPKATGIPMSSSEEYFRYSVSLLSRMLNSDDLNNGPSQETFERVLIILNKSQLPQAGELAEEILSKMEIRRAGTPNGNLTIDVIVYDHVLRCWQVAAQEGYPGAAKRALRRLDSLEAQCGIAGLPLPLLNTYNDLEKEAASAAFNQSLRPHVHTYDIVIQTCLKTQNPADKESSLRIAFEVVDRIIEHRIPLSLPTITMLIRCCQKLLPKGSPQKVELLVHVATLAFNHGLLNDQIRTQITKLIPEEKIAHLVNN